MAQHKNYHIIRYGTAEGEISFGDVHLDNVKNGVMLKSGWHPEHYMAMDGPGGEEHRTHSTNFYGPGSFQVTHGLGVPDEQPAIYMDAVNGDIVIRAAKGRIRLEAIDVDIVAMGGDDARGNVHIRANDKFIVESQFVDCKAKVAAKFFSNKTVEIVGENVLNMYGGFMDLTDGAATAPSAKGSKNLTDPALGTLWEKQMRLGFAGDIASLF